MKHNFRPVYGILIIGLFFLYTAFSKKSRIDSYSPRIDQWIRLGMEVYRQDPNRALMYWDSAVDHAERSGHRLLQVEALSARTNYTRDKFLLNDWKGDLIRIDSLLALVGEDAGPERDSLKMENERQWGFFYYALGLFSRALPHFETYGIYLKHKEKNREICAKLYSTSQFAASIYHQIGAYDSAIQEAINSLQYYECYRDTSQPADYRQPYLQIARFYRSKGDLKAAGPYYLDALDMLKQRLENESISEREAILSLCKIAEYLLHTQQPVRARNLLEQALDLFDQKDIHGVQIYTLLGDLQRQNGNIAAAVEQYQRAAGEYRRLQGEKSLNLAQVNQRIGQAFREIGDLPTALHYQREAIGNLVLHFDISANDLADIPAYPIIGKPELIEILHEAAEVSKILYENTKGPEWLQEASASIRLAVNLHQQAKNDLLLQRERQLQIAATYPVYETALEIEVLQYGHSQEADCLERLLVLSDQAKSMIPLEVVHQVSGAEGEVSELLDQEQLLKTELNRKEQDIFNRQHQSEDTTGLAQLLSEKKQLDYQLVNWSRQVQREHPNYFKLKLQREDISIDKIRRELLRPQQAMIDFFWGEHALFTLLISQDEVRIWETAVQPLADSLTFYLHLLQDPISREHVGFQKRLKQTSHFLFQSLLAQPLASLDTGIHELMIIRDGLLGFLPFELLVQHPGDHATFAPEDFLVNHYDISYANSASLLLRQSRIDQPPPPYDFAGFAPDYPETEIRATDTLSNTPLAFVLRSEYSALPGAAAELKTIRQLLGGTIFQNDRATEENFRQIAGQYKILHFAMHALANNEQPQFSELVFSILPPNDTSDGRLRAIELYNLQINAQLAVLSACNTGFGQWKRGEGMVSLGHAFTYAGVPSIVMSQWKVPDQATAEIMAVFYTNLKAGQAKDVALAAAKRDFLTQHPEMAHPLFWAGFIAYGDMSPIALSATPFVWFRDNPGLVCLLAVLSIAFLWQVYRRLKE